MSRIKILAKRSSFIERSVTFEVDGALKTISAPAANATFDDLISQIERQYGDNENDNTVDKKDLNKTESETAVKTASSKSSKKKTAQQEPVTGTDN